MLARIFFFSEALMRFEDRKVFCLRCARDAEPTRDNLGCLCGRCGSRRLFRGTWAGLMLRLAGDRKAAVRLGVQRFGEAYLAAYN
jgi:DNA-directed RNA polymerase subunit RPC12/RpoP